MYTRSRRARASVPVLFTRGHFKKAQEYSVMKGQITFARLWETARAERVASNFGRQEGALARITERPRARSLVCSRAAAWRWRSRWPRRYGRFLRRARRGSAAAAPMLGATTLVTHSSDWRRRRPAYAARARRGPISTRGQRRRTGTRRKRAPARPRTRPKKHAKFPKNTRFLCAVTCFFLPRFKSRR